MRNRIIIFLIYLLLFIFICSYFVEFRGYDEYSLANKRNLTEKKIRQFENDVKLGKNIEVSDYLKDDSIDYSNQLTRKTSELNIKLNDYLKHLIQDVFKIFKRLVC